MHDICQRVISLWLGKISLSHKVISVSKATYYTGYNLILAHKHLMSVSKCEDLNCISLLFFLGMCVYHNYLILIDETHQILNLNLKFKMNLQDILDLEKR